MAPISRSSSGRLLHECEPLQAKTYAYILRDLGETMISGSQYITIKAFTVDKRLCSLSHSVDGLMKELFKRFCLNIFGDECCAFTECYMSDKQYIISKPTRNHSGRIVNSNKEGERGPSFVLVTP